MIEFPLNLRPAAHVDAKPAAWFIPGANPQVWLAEIAVWGVPMQDLSLYVLPTSVRDRTSSGVLVLTPAGQIPSRVLRAQPYQRIGERLFVPMDAVLHPPVEESELKSKLHLAENVLHPSAGLIGFASEDRLRVRDLLAAPPMRPQVWDRAIAGDPVSDRLISVEPIDAPDPGQTLELGRGDIGSEAPSHAPPGPDESTIRKAIEWLSLPAAGLTAGASALPLKLSQWFGKMTPHGGASRSGSAGKGPKSPGWLEGFNRWATSQFASLSKSLLDARAREIERLRNLLKSNPDEGLKYAIPLRSLGTRGRTPPGGSLRQRDVQFDLGRLFGMGRAADAWDIPPAVVEDLKSKYREAANRELRLGRYRRSAYIFAELLGDLPAAASALEQGRHFREAAVLYRDHLKAPQKAAECLERGGLLTEAVRLYEQLGLWEKAGDVHAKLDRRDDAERCYRLQVEAHVQHADFVSAAHVLETKLAVPDEALAMLVSVGPTSRSWGTCLRAAFQLMGRLGRHEQAGLFVRKLRENLAPSGSETILTDSLAAVSKQYPDSRIRLLSADATRVLCGMALADSDFSDRAAMARCVATLNPEDRLLARDANRYLNRPTARPQPKQRVRSGQDPVVLRQFRLTDQVTWKAVTRTETGFCAVGTLGGECFALRGYWDGRTEGAVWNRSPALTIDGEWMLHPAYWMLYPAPGLEMVFVTPFAPSEHPLRLPKTDAFPRETEFGPGWLRGSFERTRLEARAIANDRANRATWILRQESLDVHAHDADLVASYSIPHPPPGDASFHMVVRAGYAYVAWGSGILICYRTSGFRIEPVPRLVRRLALSDGPRGFHIAAALSEGGVLLQEDGENRPFADGLFDPQIAFTRGGVLVAADGRIGRTYRIDSGKPRWRGDFTSPGPSLLAITPTTQLDEFATFTTDGKVTVYKLPAA